MMDLWAYRNGAKNDFSGSLTDNAFTGAYGVAEATPCETRLFINLICGLAERVEADP
jgi:hypothetical protein